MPLSTSALISLRKICRRARWALTWTRRIWQKFSSPSNHGFLVLWSQDQARGTRPEPREVFVSALTSPPGRGDPVSSCAKFAHNLLGRYHASRLIRTSGNFQQFMHGRLTPPAHFLESRIAIELLGPPCQAGHATGQPRGVATARNGGSHAVASGQSLRSVSSSRPGQCGLAGRSTRTAWRPDCGASITRSC